MRKPNQIILLIILLLSSIFLIFTFTNSGKNIPAEGPIFTNTALAAHTEEKKTEIGATALPATVEASDVEIKTEPTLSSPEKMEIIESDQSVLSNSQREKLILVSQKLITQNEEDTFVIAKSLDYATYPHPRTLSGPLAISILREAGLVSKYIDLRDFWLLNIRDSYTVRIVLEKNFPAEDYLWTRNIKALTDIDFNEFPLYSGDLLYLYAGYSGNFEQILVVNRVDLDGKVFAVSVDFSNTEDYLIQELMLYDPNTPGEGYFYDIAKEFKNGNITGEGGFQL